MCIMETIVIAQSISDTKIRYSCPFCFRNKSGQVFRSQHYKNGKVAKGRSPTVHHHGNDTRRLENFRTDRFSHCLIDRTPVEIHITDDTTRIE